MPILTIQLRNEEHPSRHLLSRLLAGDLDDKERGTTEKHVSSCSECKDLLVRIKVELESFHTSHNKENFLAQVKELAESTQTKHLAWWQLAWRPAGLLAAAAMIVALMLFSIQHLPEDPDTRMKGSGIELGLFVMEGSEAKITDPSQLRHPGDRIQFHLTAPAGGYLHLLGIDEAGVLSVYFPRPGAAHESYPGGAARPVPGSVILDDTLGRERVFVLICAEAMAPDELLARVRSLSGDPQQLLEAQELDLDCRQASVLITKEAK